LIRFGWGSGLRYDVKNGCEKREEENAIKDWGTNGWMGYYIVVMM
jgi:hypothetical protein